MENSITLIIGTYIIQTIAFGTIGGALGFSGVSCKTLRYWIIIFCCVAIYLCGMLRGRGNW
jgi:hypothetical protein